MSCKYLIENDIGGCFDHPHYTYKCALGNTILTPEITCASCKVNGKTHKAMEEHFKVAKELFDTKNIVMLALQGSQNYGLDTETSDVDTKLLVTPTLDDIIYCRSPKSHTYTLPNDEHLDYKDVRLYFDCIRKQNPNFIEILFTDHYYLGEPYADIIKDMISKREEIGRSNPVATIQATRGSIKNKIHCYKNPSTPKKVETINKYGYDPKEFCQIMRLEYFAVAFLSGLPYKDCLRPSKRDLETLRSFKRGELTMAEADKMVDTIVENTLKICENYIEKHKATIDPSIDKYLDQMQKEIMLRSLRNESLLY